MSRFGPPLIGFALAAIAFLVYAWVGPDQHATDPYLPLADAWLHGRADLDGSYYTWIELALYRGRRRPCAGGSPAPARGGRGRGPAEGARRARPRPGGRDGRGRARDARPGAGHRRLHPRALRLAVRVRLRADHVA